jgi:tetratricopeptide (TPR) repeat protein
MKPTGILAVCVLALLPFLAGCGTTARRDGGSARSAAASAPSRLTDDEWETRVNALSRFAAGISAEMRGDNKAALESFRAAAFADPGNQELVLEAGTRLLRARQPDAAIEVFTRATEQGAGSAMVYAWLGAALTRANRLDDALAASRRALKLDPTLAFAWQNVLNLHLQAGRLEDARRALDEAEPQMNSSSGALLDLADFYSRYLRAAPKEAAAIRPRALAALARAEHLADGDPLLWLRLGDSYGRFTDHRSAVMAYERLLALRPNFPGLREKLVEASLRADENEKAEQYLKDIVGDNPANPRLYYLLGTIAAEDPRPERRTEKLREAVGQFEKVLKLNPSFEPAHYDLARARLQLNDASSALKGLDTARGLFGETYLLELLTAMAHGQNKDYSQAVKHYTSAELIAKTSETNRLNETLYFQIGAAHERNKDFATAEKYFRQALALAPDFAEALNYLGYMWAERGENLVEAQTMIEKALKLEPDNGAFLDSMAWVLYQQGKVKEALPWMEKALQHTREPDPTLYDHLGDVYWKLGKTEQARDAWRKSLELEKNPAVQRKLDAPPGQPVS